MNKMGKLKLEKNLKEAKKFIEIANGSKKQSEFHTYIASLKEVYNTDIALHEENEVIIKLLKNYRE